MPMIAKCTSSAKGIPKGGRHFYYTVAKYKSAGVEYWQIKVWQIGHRPPDPKICLPPIF